jgi:hypothetical protein
MSAAWRASSATNNDIAGLRSIGQELELCNFGSRRSSQANFAGSLGCIYAGGFPARRRRSVSLPIKLPGMPSFTIAAGSTEAYGSSPSAISMS